MICRQIINISSKYNENVCSLQAPNIAFARDGNYISIESVNCVGEISLAHNGNEVFVKRVRIR